MIPQNMIPLLNDVARQFLRDHDDDAPQACTNVQFARDAAASRCAIVNYNHFVEVGRISCQSGEQRYENPRPVMVHCADLKAQEFEGSLSSSMEIAFFRLLVSKMAERTQTPLDHLFPRAYVSRTCWTPTSHRLVTIFYCPEQMCGRGLPQLQRMELMARAIGEFHAYSFQVRLLPSGFGNVGAFLRTTFRPAERIVEELRRCLQILRQRPCCLPGPGQLPVYVDGAIRIEALLDDFDARLQRAFNQEAAGHCWVLCHQNYSEASVVLGIEQHRPQVQMFNWHSVGFASLAVDLVIWLFADCQPGLGDNEDIVLRIVTSYREGAATTFGYNIVPNVAAILEQVRMCIPVALYVLANRTLYEQRVRPEDADRVRLENENRIVAVYEQLIRFEYV